MIWKKEMAVSHDNMWLIVSLMAVIKCFKSIPSNTSRSTFPKLATTPIKSTCIKRCCDCSKQCT